MNIDNPNFEINYKTEACKLAADIDKCFTGQPRAICLSALEVNIMEIIKLAVEDMNLMENSKQGEQKQALHQWLDLFNNNILGIIEST